MSNEEKENKVNKEQDFVFNVRLFIPSSDIRCIIGNNGDTLKRFRHESQAKISVSDGCSSERIVTLYGSIDNVCSAFQQIADTLDQFLRHQGRGATEGVTMKLIIPATHCGSVIGRGGVKIKELRQMSGAHVQVSSELLAESTERQVSICGMPEDATRALYQILLIFMEVAQQPPKGVVLPYKPKPSNSSNITRPVVMSGGKPYTIHGAYAVPAQEIKGKKTPHPLADLALLGLEGTVSNTLAPAALAALAGTQLINVSDDGGGTVREIVIPSYNIGCVIGKAGNKLKEIRQLSGADIKIPKPIVIKDPDYENIIKLSGTRDSVSLAEQLINMTIEMYRTKSPINKIDEMIVPEDVDNAISSFIASNPSTSKPKSSNLESNSVATSNLVELLANIKSSSATGTIQTSGAYWSKKKLND